MCVRACASASQCVGPLPQLVKRSTMKWVCRYELRDTGWLLTKNEGKKERQKTGKTRQRTVKQTRRTSDFDIMGFPLNVTVAVNTPHPYPLPLRVSTHTHTHTHLLTHTAAHKFH